MARRGATKDRKRQLQRAVEHYESLRTDFDNLGQFLRTTLAEDARLEPLIHSSKYRTMDSDHLLDKLCRKEIKRRNEDSSLPKVTVDIHAC